MEVIVEFPDSLTETDVAGVLGNLTLELVTTDGQPTASTCSVTVSDSEFFLAFGQCMDVGDGEYRLVVGGLPNDLFLIENECGVLPLAGPGDRASCFVRITDQDPAAPPYSIRVNLSSIDSDVIQVTGSPVIRSAGVVVDASRCQSVGDFLDCTVDAGTYSVDVEGLAAGEAVVVTCFAAEGADPSNLVFPADSNSYNCEALIGAPSVTLFDVGPTIPGLPPGAIDLLDSSGASVTSSCVAQESFLDCTALEFGEYTATMDTALGSDQVVSCVPQRDEQPSATAMSAPSFEVSAAIPFWSCEFRTVPLVYFDITWYPGSGALRPADGVNQLRFQLRDLANSPVGACRQLLSAPGANGTQRATVVCTGIDDETDYTAQLVDPPPSFVYRVDCARINFFDAGAICPVTVSAIGAASPSVTDPLPSVGASTTPLAVMGAAFIALGAALMWTTRRRGVTAHI